MVGAPSATRTNRGDVKVPHVPVETAQGPEVGQRLEGKGGGTKTDLEKDQELRMPGVASGLIEEDYGNLARVGS